MIRLAALAALVAAPALATPTAPALPHCAPRAEMGAALLASFGETPSEPMPMRDGSRYYEMWTNSFTGTWTLTLTDTSGLTCLLWSGVYRFIAAA